MDLRRLLTLSAVSLLLVGTLAGCLNKPAVGDDEDEGPPAPVVPVDWPSLALPFGEAHDHLDATHHENLSTPNFEVVGWDPLITEHHGRTSGSYMCGDVSEGDDRTIGVVHSHLSDVAFVVVDLTDPAAPTMLGELVMANTFIYDVAVTPDARFVALATSDPSQEDEPPFFAGKAVFRDCQGETHPVPVAPRVQGPLDDAPLASGVVLVDLVDPAAPEIVDWTPMPLLGAHSVYATEIDGTYHILGAATNLEHHGSFFQFITIDTLPTGPKMVVQSTYRPAPPTEGEQPRINGHVDGWIQKHPVTGMVVAYLADWDGGLVIVDLSDPKVPREIGRWTNYAGQPATTVYGDDSGSVHTAVPMYTTWDDRHYTFIGQEVVGAPSNTPTGVIYIIDTTDPSDPHPVGAWTLPVEAKWGATLMFSTHYVTLFEESRMLFVTMYHGGVWAVDVSNVTAPDTRGVFLPTNVSPKPPGDLYSAYNWAPTVLEAEAIGPDLLAVWDGGSGVYTVRWAPDVVVPDVPEWPVTF